MPSAMDPDTAEGQPGQRWISLRELAEIRGISQHSATRLVRRNGWRRQRDNRGHVLALVPAEALDLPGASPEGRQRASPGQPPDMAHAIGALESAVTALREQLTAANERAAAAEGRAHRADDQAAELRERIDALQAEVVTLRRTLDTAEAEGAAADVQAAELTAQLRQARADAQTLVQAADDLRQADEARRVAGLWTRLRAAWRGE
jgi:hypothetical protein